MKNKRFAIFDLDKTFSCIDTMTPWTYWMHQQGWIDDAFLQKYEELGKSYHSGDPSYIPSEALRHIITPLIGKTPQTLQEAMSDVVVTYVQQTFYPEMITKLHSFKTEGFTTILLSASLEVYVQEVARLLPDFDEALGTRTLQDEEGKIKDIHPEGPALGEGKIHRLRQYFLEQHIPLEEVLPQTFFLSDSIRDLPLLSIVGHPFAANPDNLLEEKAIHWGWPYKHFDAPPEAKDLPFPA